MTSYLANPYIRFELPSLDVESRDCTEDVENVGVVVDILNRTTSIVNLVPGTDEQSVHIQTYPIQ